MKGSLIFLFQCIAAFVVFGQEPEITIYYLGHSSFLINCDNELTVLTDYGKPDAWIDYGWSSPVNSIGALKPDIATYSHAHEDHFDLSRIDTNSTRCYLGDGELNFRGLKIIPISTSEKDIEVDDNKSYRFEYKGVIILHLGDCQANIMAIEDEAKRKAFFDKIPGDIDIVLFPIEGTQKFLAEASSFVKIFNADIFIPMHYWSQDYKNEFFKACKNIDNARILHTQSNIYRFGLEKSPGIKTIVNMTGGELTLEDSD